MGGGGGGGGGPCGEEAPNQLIEIDSTIHTYARLMGRISAERGGRAAAKTTTCDGQKEDGDHEVGTSKDVGPRNWFAVVAYRHAKLCF